MSATLVGCGCGCEPSLDPCLCAGVISIQTFCATRSGSYALCGYDEYTTPSVPPKRYLRKNFGGKNTVKQYTGPGCSGPLLAGTCIVSPSGSNHYAPTSAGCGTVNVGGSANVQGGASTGTVPVTSITNAFCAFDCGAKESTMTRTTLTIRATLMGGGTACSGTCEAGGDSMTETLSSEDTEQNAIDRSTAIWSDYSPSGGGCCSGMEARSAGIFVGTYYESKLKIIVRGTKGALANIDVPFSRVPYGGTPTSESWVDTFQVAFGDTGEAQLDVTIPSKSGFTTCAGPARASPDQPAQQ